MPTIESKLVDLELELRHETKDAFLLYDGDKQAWCAKSLVENHGDGVFTMPRWLAVDKGFV